MKRVIKVQPVLICLATVTAWLMPLESFGQAKISIAKAVARSQKEKPVKIDEEVETESSLKTTSGKRNSETATVIVTLKNSGTESATGQLEWAFISDYSSGQQDPDDREKPAEAERTVFSPGKKTITLDAGQTVEETIVSQPFVYEEKTIETEKYDSSGNSSSTKDIEEGNIYKGYLVLFTVNGEVVAKKASSSSYTKPNWIALCRNPPAPPKKKKKK